MKNKSKKKIDYSLYVVTDRSLMKSKSVEESVEKAILGGAGVIQLREKDITSRQFYETALKVKVVCDRLEAVFLINDRLDIAMAVDADGVHLGQKDLPVDVARKILGSGKIIGASTATVEEAKEAERLGADYIGVGAMFSTETKKDTRSVSPELLKEICSSINIPAVAIGGLKLEKIKALKDTGVSGAAVVSAVVAQEDIKKAAEAMKKEILKYIGE